jgi:lipoate-protein ligase A
MAEQLPHASWRVIRSAPGRGAWNMALDEAILESSRIGQTPPTLRLYAWSPPCLSLGRAQPVRDVLLAELEERGWDLVRRPTGGRAILHTDELTYSIAGPQSEPRLSGGVLDSYRVLAQALLHALRLLNIPAQALEYPAGSVRLNPASPGQNAKTENPVCFEVPSNYEITVYGKKLIGSAQARRKEGVLQHGSLPLYGDLARITQVLAFEDAASREAAAVRLLERAATAEAILGTPLSWEQAADAFVVAFAETLNLELKPSEPTPAEWRMAEELVGEKYASTEWTNRT